MSAYPRTTPAKPLAHSGGHGSLFVEYVQRSEPFSMTDNHFHDYYEIYILLSGEREYFIKDRTYQVGPGEAVFIGKNELHKTLHAGSPCHERILIHFDDRLLHQLSQVLPKWLLAPFHSEIRVLRLPDRELMTALTARMVKELQDRLPGCELALQNIVSDLLLEAGRYASQLQEADPIPFPHASPMHGKISEIVRFINDNFAQHLQLTMLAERFFVSPYHLSRTFKEITGFTFTDYVNLTRVKEAQRLLRETDLSITDVAAGAGFENFSHFGKTFKKITHVTPRAYRNSFARFN